MEETRAVEHRLEITSSFFDGYTAQCSCGWHSEEMATHNAALAKGREHQAQA